MDPKLYDLIQQAINNGITTASITSGIIAVLAAGCGAWITRIDRNLFRELS